MSIQFIQNKKENGIVLGILIALCNDFIEGLARYGCGVAGLPYYEDHESQ
jgi:hypothetical protein